MKRARQSPERRRRRRRRRHRVGRKNVFELAANERLRFVKFASQVAPRPRPERRRRGALIRKITQYKASPAFARVDASSVTRDSSSVAFVFASRTRTSSSTPPLVDVDAAIARTAREDARPTLRSHFRARARTRRTARRAPTVELMSAASDPPLPARALDPRARPTRRATARSTARVSPSTLGRALGRASTRARARETTARIEVTRAGPHLASRRERRPRDRARDRGSRPSSSSSSSFSSLARSRRVARRRASSRDVPDGVARATPGDIEHAAREGRRDEGRR